MNAILWFEIPATDLNRAYKFYSNIFLNKVRMGTFGTDEIILFDVPFATGEAVGGSIVKREHLLPSTHGPIIYLNAFDSLSNVVNRLKSVQAKIIQEEINLGKFGFACIAIDSEGNRIGILSNEK